MKKNNLFIFHPYSGIGGADRSIARVINGIKKKNLEIFFISLKKPKIKIFIKKKINYITLNESRTLFGIIKLKKIIKNLISKETKNIFLSNQNYANVLSIFFLRKIDNLKLVLIERNSLKELYFHSNLMDLLKKKL